MTQHRTEIQQPAEEFKTCEKALLALGDANRQHLIVEMIQIGNCEGGRVGEITKKTPLPALQCLIISESSRMRMPHDIDLMRTCAAFEKHGIRSSDQALLQQYGLGNLLYGLDWGLK